MASVEKVSTGWRARWRSPDGGSRSKTFARKVDAERFLTTVDSAKLSGSYVDPSLGRRTFGDYASSWLTTKVDVTSRTRINVEGRLQNHVLPVLGGIPLASIRPEDIRLLVATMVTQKRLAPSTVKAVYLTTSQVLETAEIDGLIGRSPCRGVKLPEEPEGEEMLFLTPEQVVLLAETIEPRFRALVLCAAYSGMRAGELSALKLQRIDFLRGRIRVTEAHSEVRGRLETKTTKSRRKREVPIPRALVDELAEHVQRFPSSGGFVFTAPAGGPLRHHNFYMRSYRQAVEAAGLPAGLRFHDLRHTAAAILIDQGCNEKQLQVILGDTSRAIERYKHLFDGHEEALMGRLDAVYRRTAVSDLCHGAQIRALQSPAEGAESAL
ncbi:MAG: tyrosine-type recombinase/integrase [Acidimicrobiaceae bacterium]|nr:tyrosine-type recombinase/integrase [Acidimicrobiaceae bacterium]